MSPFVVAIVSGPDHASLSGLKNFFAANNIDYFHWRKPEEVEPGDGLVILLRSDSESETHLLDETTRAAVAGGWVLFNWSMPWIQDKEEEYLLYRRLDFDNILPTVFVGRGSDDVDEIIADDYIVKPTEGSGGRGVERFDSWGEALAYGKSLARAMIQPFQQGELWRVIVAPEVILTTYAKIAPSGDQWLAAVSQGASRQQRRLPHKFAEVLLDLIDKLGADLVGFDIIVFDDRFVLLETNAAPSLAEEVIAMIDNDSLVDVFYNPLLDDKFYLDD